MNFIDEYIAPWSLPNGTIPFHCLWDPIDTLQKICFTLPKDYELLDTLNFTSYHFDSESRVVSILSEDLKSNNYFGAVIKYNKIFDSIERSDEIIIYYLDKDDVELSNIILKTRIVRPLLISNIEKGIQPIIINDDTNLDKLINLDILHKGFGSAYIDIYVSRMGKDISRFNSLYFDMINEMGERVSSIIDPDIIEEDSTGIDEDMLRTLQESLINVFHKKELPRFINKEDIEDFEKIFSEPSKREKLLGLLIQNLNTVYMTTLLWYNERNPREDVKLLYGNMAAIFSGKIDELQIKITYHDSVNNEYSPLNINLLVIDNRKTTEDEIKIPVNIKWERDILEL